MTRELRARWALGGLGFLLAAATLASVGTGPMPLSFTDSLSLLLDRLGVWQSGLPDAMAHVVSSIRLPRTLLGIVVGAALAVSGAAIQGLFRNPLADPGLIGVTGGAALFAVATIVLGGTTLAWLNTLLGPYALMLPSFLGGFLATLMVSRIATSRFGTSISTLLLAGIAINIATGAAVGVLTYMADDAQLRTLTFWSMGSLGGATWQTVISAGSLIAITVILLPRESKNLNALLLGESEARHLGVKVEDVKKRIMILSATAVGACVAVAGVIGFVGLVVPHIVRMTLGPDHRYLIPASALLGALFLTFADMLSRVLVAPAEIPIGLITSIVGGPFFIIMVVLQAKRHRL